jgi:hypothetical protein
MSTKDKLLRRPQSITAFRVKVGGLNTTVAAAGAVGDTTVTPGAVTAVAAGKSYVYDDGEVLERVEVASLADGVITLVKPLLRPHAAGVKFREQTGYSLGDSKGAITPTQTIENTDVQSSMRRLVFQRIQGYQTFPIDLTVFGTSLYNIAHALGIPFTRIAGDGTDISTPLVLTTDFTDVDTENDVCLVNTYVLQDGTIKTQEFWGVYPDYTSFAVQLATGQDGAVPMKLAVYGMGVEQDGAPTFTADTSKTATKGKVFAELSKVGLYVANQSPHATTVADDADAGATTLDLTSGTGYAANDWILVGTPDAGEIHWVDSVDTNALTLRTPLLNPQLAGVAVSRLSELLFAAITKDGAKLAVGGQTSPIQSGLRRLPLGSFPGFVDVSLTLALLELTLANRAYGLGIDQGEIANARLVLSEKIGLATIVGAFCEGVLKDGTVNRFNFWNPVQDLSNVATAFGDPNGASIPFVAKPTTGVQLIQYAA